MSNHLPDGGPGPAGDWRIPPGVGFLNIVEDSCEDWFIVGSWEVDW